MPPSRPAAPASDLRSGTVDRVLTEAERALAVTLDPATLVRKRRSLGARTDRDTWVRVERRTLDRIGAQGWNGTECAAMLHGVARPAWHRGATWPEPGRPVMWRADEMDLLPDAPVGSSVLAADPTLPDEWWRALNVSLDALSRHRTRRVATPDTVPITQNGVTRAVAPFLPTAADTAVTTWQPAHADLTWANMTGPRFCLFDWEDWGLAPRGLDAAALWGNSLAVPSLAARVRRERGQDLETRDGRLMTLFVCAKLLSPDAHPADPRLGPAREMVARVVEELQRG